MLVQLRIYLTINVTDFTTNKGCINLIRVYHHLELCFLKNKFRIQIYPSEGTIKVPKFGKQNSGKNFSK